MQPKNRLQEYFAGDSSALPRNSAFKAAAKATDAQPEVERHVSRVRGSVAQLLRALKGLDHPSSLEEQSLIDSCLGCADALEDLLMFLYPKSHGEREDNPS